MKKQNQKRIKIIFVIVSVILAVTLSIFLFFRAKKFFRETSLFKVKRIKTNLGKERLDLPQGIINKKSIFFLNINRLSSNLKETYPQYKDAIVKRIFPDTLYIEFIKRKPLFQIEVGREFHLIDEESIIIATSKDKPYPNIVLVHPLLSKNLKLYLGKKVYFPYESEVVSLIKELKHQVFFESFNISSLSAYSINDIWFKLNGIKIRVGNGRYRKKLGTLKRLILPRFKDELKRIEYIDLRFKDYIVGYKR